MPLRFGAVGAWVSTVKRSSRGSGSCSVRRWPGRGRCRSRRASGLAGVWAAPGPEQGPKLGVPLSIEQAKVDPAPRSGR